MKAFVEDKLAPMVLSVIHRTFAESVDQDQSAQNVQSDLDLHCPIWRFFSAYYIFEIATVGVLLSTSIFSFSPFHTIPTFDDTENIEGKGENAGNQHFLLFPQYFLPLSKTKSLFTHIDFVVCKCFLFGPV